MTDDAPLATLLRTSTVSADAPPVDRLRGVIAARRRRRRALAAAAVAVPILALIGSMARWSGDDPERLETVDRTTTSEPSTDAAPDPTITTPRTTVEAAPVAEPALSPPILVPTGWDLQFLSSTNLAMPSGHVTLITDAGDLGPMAVVGFNADVDTLDYADGPPTNRDTTSPGGRTVRVGHGDDPDRLTAIFLVDGGSVAITGFDIGEAALLELSDAVDVVDGDLVIASGALPGGLRIESPVFDRPALTTSYTLMLGTTTVAIRVDRRRGDIQDIWEVRYRPDVIETTIDGRRTLLSPGDNGPLGETLALVLTDDWVYTIGMPPWGPDTPPATVEEIEAVVASLEPIDEAELVGRLPELRDRREILGRWFADAGPTASAELAWMLDGPPMGLGEVNYFHQLVTCAVVLDWVDTGDPATFDHLGANAEWAVSQDLARFWTDYAATQTDEGREFDAMIEDRVLDEADLVEARTAATEAERRALRLVEDCGWAAELLPGR